jgi:hypothetical protein
VTRPNLPARPKPPADVHVSVAFDGDVAAAAAALLTVLSKLNEPRDGVGSKPESEEADQAA